MAAIDLSYSLYPKSSDDNNTSIAQLLPVTMEAICTYLDEEKFDLFLSYFTAKSTYTITTFSGELRRELAYLDLDFLGLKALVNGIGDHVRFPDKLVRHITLRLINKVEDDLIFCTTTVAIYHINLSSVAGIYAIGKYRDTSQNRPGIGLQIIKRNVFLETRSFPFGSHLPL